MIQTSSVHSSGCSGTLRRKSSRRLAAALCAFTFVVAACGSDDAADPTPPQDTPQSSVDQEGTPQNSVDQKNVGVVIVANANIDNGSAGRMADALSLAGFDTGSAVTATEKLERSVVFFVDTPEAAETARQVGETMGGLPVLSLLDDQVWTEAGTLDGGDVLVLLGQNESDRTLDDLNGGNGGGGSTTGGTDEPVGGTVECSESALRAGLEDYEDIVSIDSFQCQDGWAVVELTVDGGTEDPEYTIAGIAVLEAEGQFWISKDRDDVCGSLPEIDDNGQPIRPDDAQVPASLWWACTVL